MLIKDVLADALQKRSCQGNSSLRISFPPFHSFEPETVNSLRVKFLKNNRDSLVSGCGCRAFHALEQWPKSTPYELSSFCIACVFVFNELPEFSKTTAGSQKSRCNVFEQGIVDYLMTKRLIRNCIATFSCGPCN